MIESHVLLGRMNSSCRAVKQGSESFSILNRNNMNYCKIYKPYILLAKGLLVAGWGKGHYHFLCSFSDIALKLIHHIYLIGGILLPSCLNDVLGSSVYSFESNYNTESLFSDLVRLSLHFITSFLAVELITIIKCRR